MAFKLTTPAPGWACLRSARIGPATADRLAQVVEASGIVDVPGVKWTFDRDASYAELQAHQNVIGTASWQRVSDLLGLPAFVDERKRVDPFFTDAELATLYPHQVEAVRFLCRNGGGLLADAMGLGKGLLETEPVLTPEGWKEIGALRVGELVVDPDGGAAQVTAVYPRGELDLFRVGLSDGTSVVTDAEHLWVVQTPDRKVRGNAPLLLSTQEMLTRGLHVRSKRGDRRSRFFLPTDVQHATGHPWTKLLPIDPYVLGVLLGDGYLRGTPVVSTPSQEIHAAVQATYPTRWQPAASERCPTFTVSCPSLEPLGLLGAKAPDKFVPNLYLFAGRDARCALLAGLLDTDGTIDRTGKIVTYSSASKRLADHVAALVRSLGGVASRFRKEKTRYSYLGELREGLPAEIVNIRLPFNPFRHRRERFERWRPQMLTRAVESIEPAGRGRSVCITVSSKRSLFFTRDYIPTHNTRSAAHAARQFRRAHGEDRPTLILGPKFVRRVWRDELDRLGFLEHERDWFQFESIDATQETWSGMRRASWWFCHYDIAFAWSGRWVVGAARAPRVVILDEAHAVRNAQTRRGKAAHACVGTIPHRILLTGTPIANRPRELWSLLTLLHGSYSWGSPSAYRRRYCGAEDQGYGLVDTEPTNVEELQARMSGSYLRRTIDDVAISLPPLTRSMLRVEEADRDAHRVSPENLRAILAALERGTFGTDTLAMMQRLMKATSAAKRNATSEHVRNLVEQDESAVIFTQERKMAERLSSDVEGSVWVHGALEQDERDEIVARFQDGHYTALVATYGALREGVTLHRARHVVLHDLSWVPSEVLQAEARVYRIGQRRCSSSTWVVLESSFDTLLASHLIRKASAIASALQDSSAANALAAVGIAQRGVEHEARALLKAWNVLEGGAV